MKPSQASSGKEQEGTVSAVEASAVANEAILSFIRNADNVAYELRIDMNKLPWESDSFRRAVLKCDWNSLVYRSDSARKELVKIGLPLTDEKEFVRIIEAVSYRGDAVPNKDDKAKAAKQMQGIESKVTTWEAIEATIATKYASHKWTLPSRTVEGLEAHFMWVRSLDEL